MKKIKLFEDFNNTLTEKDVEDQLIQVTGILKYKKNKKL